MDSFRGTEAIQTDQLHALLGVEPVCIGDLIMTEVLQGMTSDRDFRETRTLLAALDVVMLGGEAVGIQAAQNFRRLREKGITARKTIDCIIATRCIVDGITLLHSDRDFEPFVEH